MNSRCAGLLLLLALAPTAHAGVTVLLADRGANAVWRLTDGNNDGAISPNEVFLWYDATNAAGTGVSDNLNAFFVGPDGTVIGGDQVLRVFYWFKDLNGDGDALDAGESRQIASTPNPSGASTTFPTGGAFGPDGEVYVVNAGNANGVDAIYRCVDVDGDAAWMQAGEMAQWVGDSPTAFGPGNGAFSPQEIVLADGVGYLRNSSAGLHGVFRFEDINGNGRADDDGVEFRAWYTGASAGFALEPDAARPGSFYYHQLATGSFDQILRLTDADGDGNANGQDEAVLVFSTGETGFTSVDVLSLPGGDVLFTDNSGRRIIRLTDTDGDGLFTSPDERSDFFVTTGTGVVEVRQVVLMPGGPTPPNCGTADFDGDGDVGTDADIEAFFACLAGNCCATCFPGGADFNGDGDVGTDADIEAFFRVLAGGDC